MPIEIPESEDLKIKYITSTSTSLTYFDVKMAVFTVQESGFVYDLNNHCLIDIEDMIIVLQLFTRIHVDKQWMSDHQIGFDDLLLIMNRISR